jgi:Uma2 family endonuclease
MVETPAADMLSIDQQPWRDPDTWPPTDLLYDDGDKMESPWHHGAAVLILSNYAALCGGKLETSYAGANMFLYYSAQQARNREYRGPDAFIVKNVDGTRERLYWAVWEENGRYPDVIFELLSPSTEAEDLGSKKQLYEQTFRTPEYFCLTPRVERLEGWRLEHAAYVPIAPDERGWLWSEQLGVWLGPWEGLFLGRTDRWLRFYRESGDLVLLTEESARIQAEQEHQRAEQEHQRAEELAARIAEMEAELKRLRGEA